MRLAVSIALFSVIAVSCASVNQKTGGDYVIRYVNMNAIYEYVYSSSAEAKDLQNKMAALEKKISILKDAGSVNSDAELDIYEEEMSRIREQEKKLKSELYSMIRAAVKKTAEKHNADFILNSGDGVVYSRPVYDITGEVVKELKSIEKRTSPEIK